MPESDNPFLVSSLYALGFPPFDRIEVEHYRPAFERGMAAQLAEVAAITGSDEPPTFDNTLVALERSGRTLARVSRVFSAMASAHTSEAIKAIEVEISPKLSAHRDRIFLDPALFQRISAIHETRAALGLDAESLRLVEETYSDFVRAGADLDEERKERLREINAALASLSTAFSQNVLAEANELAVVVDDEGELAGLTPSEIEAAARAAADRGLDGRYVLPLLNTSQQPVMASLEKRALRRRILETSLHRGGRGNAHDNRSVLTEMARLRAERARLLGYESHAAYVLERQTAGTVEAVDARLAALTPPAVANARREAEDLQARIHAQGGDFRMKAWDWDFYAEQVRAERYAFDAARLKPYFELESVLRNGVFFAAEHLFGITFEERPELPVYHDDVRVFEVREADGSTLGLFVFDPYARPTKRGGAWMSTYVAQSELLGAKPVVANHLNIARPPDGEPTLLTFDEVTTAFHEFGHALHGLFSDVTYPSFSGTRVPRDFVEFPSQVYEVWATRPEVLRSYARHHETGETIPDELVDRVRAAERFNQGYATTEYLEAALLDMALHTLAPDEVPSADGLMDFEERVLTEAGADPALVPPRYRYPYFNHIGGGYAAGYYSYIWAEVMDADAVEWFEANGGMTRANGDHLRTKVLSKGGSVEATELYRSFRGRDAEIGPLLERRGLVGR